MTDTKPPATTTDSGIPAASDEFSLTVGPRGPTVLHDHYLVQKIQHFNRERVPERVMHAKGSGAHGFFEVTNDVTWFTKATFWSATTHRYLRPGRNQVPGLHPLPEAPAGHWPPLQRYAMGLLDTLTRERPPGDHPDVRSGHATHLAEHERLQQSHLLVRQRGWRTLLGEVPTWSRPCQPRLMEG